MRQGGTWEPGGNEPNAMSRTEYAGGISDQSGIGTVGFERINDAGNRWSVPILAGVYVKF